ncbi:MAG TPA: hypothetical protein PLJ27_04160 [Polyangiaceae bacterium]|jgi:type III secretion protein J|nr:MAG: Yop proteins translocation lipoprotein J precursor [Deltaproteobacteria bacterium ADurb.Bin207]HNS99257.1 hypothetical protein [Polyangiaceae bacterium]HNZ20881.1 hypothetical protein [Polyangiaceae bacterium]HOD21454.1 hypothetical protein [Polyangiaceae bacterium]HOE47562.1 hypothetical protein [Polyangiaceae bacterium]
MRKNAVTTTVKVMACMAIACAVVGCSVPVAGGLDERDANLVADALNRSGIDATKETDPAVEGRYQVSVSRGEAASAIATLRDNDLPPRHAPGVIDAVGKSSLVPSPLAEHAQYVAGICGDLERSLASIDGVLGARVHLSVPSTDVVPGQPSQPPSASVLLRHRGDSPPITESQVQHLVAGAVAGLAAQDVSVVTIRRPDSPDLSSREITKIGPFSVTRGSATRLRVTLGIALLLMLTLASTILYLWRRMRLAMAEQITSGEQV